MGSLTLEIPKRIAFCVSMKPVCHSEAIWKYWRDRITLKKNDKLTPWSKKMMRRARRRFLRRELFEQHPDEIPPR